MASTRQGGGDELFHGVDRDEPRGDVVEMLFTRDENQVHNHYSVLIKYYDSGHLVTNKTKESELVSRTLRVPIWSHLWP